MTAYAGHGIFSYSGTSDGGDGACRNRNHVAAFTARSTFVSVVTSLPGPTRTTAAPSAISIVPQEIAQEAAEDDAEASTSTMTGAKVALPVTAAP